MKITYSETITEDQWKEYRDIKIESIIQYPDAFSANLKELKEFSEEEWKKIIKEVNIKLFFVKSDEKIIGMIRVYFYREKKFKHNASIDSLYVNKNYQNQGIATNLLKTALDFIEKQKSILNIHSEVFSSQQSSLEVHKKLGFQIVGKVKDFIKTKDGYFDSIFLQKTINK